jgi:tetratricopeptide (TPR) repeat protein
VVDEDRLRALQERAENPPSIDEGLAASKELVEVLGPLAAEAPATYQFQHATAWKLRGAYLGLTEDQAAAEEAFATAVRLFRGLATDTDPESLYTLAVSLIDLTEHRLKGDGGVQEALTWIEEVRDLCQRLERLYPGMAHETEAHAFRLHAQALHQLGEHQAAIEQAERAHTGLQRLERRHPEARPYVAGNLRVLGVSLMEVNRLKDARKKLEEAAWLFRRLSKREPEFYLGEQAAVTFMIAVIWMMEGKKTRSLGNYEAAVQLYRDAARVNPGHHEDYRKAVHSLVETYTTLGDQGGADRMRRKYPV